MSDLQPSLDKLFEECRQMCQKLTAEASIEDTKQYEGELMLLVRTWIVHNDRTIELLNKAMWKCQANKRILMNQGGQN